VAKYTDSMVLNGPVINPEDRRILSRLALGDDTPSENFYLDFTQPASSHGKKY
jgi:hypothetical protein